MDRIKKFITEFIQAEFIAEKSKYNITVSDEDYKILVAKTYHSFYNLIVSNPHGRGRSVNQIIGDETWEMRWNRTYSSFIPRILFQIKHYINPKLGEALARFVTGKDIYACYLSYNQSGGKELYFSSIYFVSETNEGLKIIYTMSFDSKKGIWYHPNELDTTRVIDPGKLIEVEKYQAPEEESSLLDYNKE